MKWKFTDPTNQVVWRALADGRQQSMLVSAREVIEWLAEGNTPLPADPVPVPPIVVKPRQIRQALTIVGLRAAVEAYVAAGDQDLRDWWEFATSFEENHPMVISAAAALGVSAAQLHEVFALAASL